MKQDYAMVITEVGKAFLVPCDLDNFDDWVELLHETFDDAFEYQVLDSPEINIGFPQ